MDIRCRLFGHKWMFGYNHGIPLGTRMSIGEVVDKLRSGQAYAVYICTKCRQQARLEGASIIILAPGEIERP